MHFYGWKKGLKTGMYYLRTRPAAQAIQFTVDQQMLQKTTEANGDQTPATPITSIKSPVVKPSYTPRKSTTPPPTYMANKGRSGMLTPTTPPPAVEVKEELTPTTETVLRNEELTPSTEDKKAEAAKLDPEYAAALERQRERELEEAKMMCSLENKEACLMCSG